MRTSCLVLYLPASDLNRLASSLIERLIHDQQGMSSIPRAQAGQNLGKITKSGRPKGQGLLHSHQNRRLSGRQTSYSRSSDGKATGSLEVIFAWASLGKTQNTKKNKNCFNNY
jgi:hypothetical protein